MPSHDSTTFTLVVETMGDGTYQSEESFFETECDSNSVTFISPTIEDVITYDIDGQIP